jgi:putative phosphoribosyl transferase
MFRDRSEAGRLLGEHLRARIEGGEDSPVLGIPRGGVLVAAPVAAALGSPLDVLVPRKIGAPGEPELAIGAVALAGAEEIVILDGATVEQLGVARSYLAAEVRRQRQEIERRLAVYREVVPALELEGRTVVVVDDGIATGLTVRAAVEAVARLGPRAVVLAAPVAPPEVVGELRRDGVRVEVLETPSPFRAVGQFYADFGPVEDDEVKAALRAFRGS